MSEQIQVAVPENIKVFVDTVAERWGYYAAIRATQSDLMKSTVAERSVVNSLGKSIASKVEAWMATGEDTREPIKELQGKLVDAKAVLKVKGEPFYAKMTEPRKAISYLDKEVIPKQLAEIRGEAVVPRFQVSEAVLRAITKPSK